MGREPAEVHSASQVPGEVTVCNGFSIAISIARCPRIVGYEGEISEPGSGTEIPLDISCIIPYKWVKEKDMKKYTVIQTYTAKDIYKNVEAESKEEAILKIGGLPVDEAVNEDTETEVKEEND